MKLSDIKSFPARVRMPTGGRTYTVYMFCNDRQKFLVWEDREIEPDCISNGNDNWVLITPKKKLHKYLVRSTDSHLPLRPILTFHFESKEDFEYYKNQHSYELISYEGEVEVNDATGI